MKRRLSIKYIKAKYTDFFWKSIFRLLSCITKPTMISSAKSQLAATPGEKNRYIGIEIVADMFEFEFGDRATRQLCITIARYELRTYMFGNVGVDTISKYMYGLSPENVYAIYGHEVAKYSLISSAKRIDKPIATK